MTLRRALGALLMTAAWAGAQPLPRWSLVHTAPLELEDFAVARDGWPAASGISPSGEPRLVTGPKFTVHPAPERLVSVWPLAADSLWAAGETGIWHSTDGGVRWQRRAEVAGLRKILFVTESRGYALGANKTILSSDDGGETWAPLAAAAEPGTSSAHTVYHWADFVTPRAGVITGSSRPPRSGVTGPLPAWRDPQGSARRPEWPAASLTIETRDGGITWKHSSTSLFGTVSRVRYSRQGLGLALVQFHDAFEYPSEVFRIDLRQGTSERVFREKDRAVTDTLILAGGETWLAAIEPPPRPSPITTGLIYLYRSQDMTRFQAQALPSDLRAGRVWLGASGGTLWAVTDRGAFLQASGKTIE